MKRVLLLLFISILIISCNSEDDCHEVLSNIVFLKIKINDTDGINLFEDENFDLPLLKILSSNGNNGEIEFSTFELDGERFIEFEFVGDIIFNYNNENKADLKFSTINSESNNCGAVIDFSFTAKSNEQTVCECDSNDVINIVFDI